MDPQATPTRLRSRGPKSILSSRSSMYVTGFFFTEFYLIFLFDRLSVSSNDFYLVLPSYRVFFVGSSSLPTLFHERCCFFYLVLLIYLFHHLCLVGPCSRGRRTTFTEFYRVFWGVHHCLRRWMQEGHSTRAQKKTRDDRRSGNWRHRRRSAGCCVSISPLTGAYRVIFAAVPSFARSSLFPRFSLAT